jgi:hypothetical protein
MLSNSNEAMQKKPDYIESGDSLSGNLDGLFSRRLRGLMSLQTFSMYLKHSAFPASFPTDRHPRGSGLWLGQIEYCSSLLQTTK